MVSNALALLNVRVLITACFCYGMWAWLLSVLSLRRVALLYGLGAIANVFLHPIVYEENIWKYGLSWPVVVVFLALTIASRSVWIDATLLAIAAFSLAFESRIHGAITFGTSVSYWFLHKRGRGRTLEEGRVRTPWLARTIVAILLGAVAYILLSSAMLGGYLGSANRLHAEAQSANTNDVLTGARPEWRATVGLMAHQPLGYGPGAIPDSEDLAAARTGLRTIGVSGLSEYYTDYMFGGHFKLHSVLADLWVSYGIAGLALGLYLGFILIGSVMATRAPNRLHLFLAGFGLWFLAFGPILSNLPQVLFAAAVAVSISTISEPPASSRALTRWLPTVRTQPIR
jgi:hypothetical protein